MVIVTMDLALGLILTKLHMLVNGRMVQKKERELKVGLMDTYMKVSLMIASGTAQEL